MGRLSGTGVGVGLLAFLWFGGVWLGSSMGQGGAFLEVRTSGEVSYVSGGVGMEERSAIQEMTKGYNLKIVFAMASGQYLSDLKVAIQEATGKTLLEAESRGPWFFAKLSPGAYKIIATMSGDKKEKSVTVGKELKTIHFHWKT